MSAHLLQNPGEFHILKDDLESFLHVLSWMTLCYSDKQNCYNVWYFCGVHNVVPTCMGISLSVGETV